MEETERWRALKDLRYFGGLSIEEVAVALGVSEATVKREWKMARAWLFTELGGLERDTNPSGPRSKSTW